MLAAWLKAEAIWIFIAAALPSLAMHDAARARDGAWEDRELWTTALDPAGEHQLLGRESGGGEVWCLVLSCSQVKQPQLCP